MAWVVWLWALMALVGCALLTLALCRVSGAADAEAEACFRRFLKEREELP